MAGESGDDLSFEGIDTDTEARGLDLHCSGHMLTGAALGFGVGVVFAFGGFWRGVLAILCMVAGAMIAYVLRPS